MSIYPVMNDFSRTGKYLDKKRDDTNVPSLFTKLNFPVLETGVKDRVYALGRNVCSSVNKSSRNYTIP